MLKFINIFTLVAVSALLFFIIYRFTRDMAKHRKRMRKLDEWSRFNKQLTNWASEIVDVNARSEFMDECVNRLVDYRSDYKNIDDFDWNFEKMKIYLSWGQHIPSLLQEVREDKLNKLVK